MPKNTRNELPHWVGEGDLLGVSSLEHLSERERREVPGGTVALFEGWRERLDALPAELAWARSSLRARTPVLERASFPPGRVYWTVRLTDPGHPYDTGPCLGGDGIALHGDVALPEPLAWLAATLGTASHVAEQSGTAPFGRPLRAFVEGGELLLDHQPEGSASWVCLYEIDGDAIFADLDTGAAHWVGHEWTGEEQVTLPVPWPSVASFVLWRMLDGGAVRPWDLDMLAAVRRATAMAPPAR